MLCMCKKAPIATARKDEKSVNSALHSGDVIETERKDVVDTAVYGHRI
ncbi:putative transcription regulator MBF1 family [Helianthus debilis subsp. tardiflorus]